MSRHIAIDADLVVTHARRVEVVADDIGVAAAAARSTDMSGGAFGVLCSFLVPAAATVTSMAVRAIDSIEGMLLRSAVEVRGVADDVSQFDDRARSVLSALDRELE